MGSFGSSPNELNLIFTLPIGGDSDFLGSPRSTSRPFPFALSPLGLVASVEMVERVPADVGGGHSLRSLISIFAESPVV